jgi:RNA polymerase sigma-70 factor (ECF subfamily)
MSDPDSLSPQTAALVLRGRRGDRRALEELIGCYQARVTGFVFAKTGDRSHCEDLCQAIFVKMVLGLSRLRDAERFEPWLFRIAHNVCRDHLRERTTWRRFFVPWEPAFDPPAELPPLPDREDEVARGIERMPEAQRHLLKLSLEEARSYEELARLVNASVPAVKSRLHRARENLKAILAAGDMK